MHHIALHGHDAKNMKRFTLHLATIAENETLDTSAEVCFPVHKAVHGAQYAWSQDPIIDPQDLDLESEHRTSLFLGTLTMWTMTDVTKLFTMRKFRLRSRRASPKMTRSPPTPSRPRAFWSRPRLLQPAQGQLGMDGWHQSTRRSRTSSWTLPSLMRTQPALAVNFKPHKKWPLLCQVMFALKPLTQVQQTEMDSEDACKYKSRLVICRKFASWSEQPTTMTNLDAPLLRLMLSLAASPDTTWSSVDITSAILNANVHHNDIVLVTPILIKMNIAKPNTVSQVKRLCMEFEKHLDSGKVNEIRRSGNWSSPMRRRMGSRCKCCASETNKSGDSIRETDWFPLTPCSATYCSWRPTQSNSPEWGDIHPWCLFFAQAHLCHTPLCQRIAQQLCDIPPKKTSIKIFCDTIATSIARYEKYLCCASEPKEMFYDNHLPVALQGRNY